MSDEKKMTIGERYKYLHQMKKRYDAADKQGRSQLLDEMEAVTGLHRKSLIQRMKGPLVGKRRPAASGPTTDAGWRCAPWGWTSLGISELHQQLCLEHSC